MKILKLLISKMLFMKFKLIAICLELKKKLHQINSYWSLKYGPDVDSKEEKNSIVFDAF